MFELVRLVKRSKRRGRGYGSGKGGHTVGRGQKGQKSRGKGKPGILHAGGNVPVYRKIPLYKGYGNPKVTAVTAVNINVLLQRIKKRGLSPKVITPKLLKKLGFAPSKDGYKVIGKPTEKLPFSFKGVKLSKGIKESTN